MAVPQNPQTLPTRVYLLAYDVDRRKATGRDKLGFLLRAAALTDLALRGALADDRGKAVVTGSAQRTGDPVLDDLLAELGGDGPRRWKALVRRRARRTIDAVQGGLADAGALNWERRTVLGIFPADRIVLGDPAEVQRQRAVVRDAVLGDAPVQRLAPQDAAVAALAASAPMRLVFRRGECRQHRKRIDELVERSGAAVPALRKVLRDIQAATAAAASSGAVGGS